MEAENTEATEQEASPPSESAEKPRGVARVPNREKGAMHSPPYVMMGVYVLLAILSAVLAKLS